MKPIYEFDYREDILKVVESFGFTKTDETPNRIAFEKPCKSAMIKLSHYGGKFIRLRIEPGQGLINSMWVKTPEDLHFMLDHSIYLNPNYTPFPDSDSNGQDNIESYSNRLPHELAAEYKDRLKKNSKSAKALLAEIGINLQKEDHYFQFSPGKHIPAIIDNGERARFLIKMGIKQKPQFIFHLFQGIWQKIRGITNL